MLGYVEPQERRTANCYLRRFALEAPHRCNRTGSPFQEKNFFDLDQIKHKTKHCTSPHLRSREIHAVRIRYRYGDDLAKWLERWRSAIHPGIGMSEMP